MIACFILRIGLLLLAGWIAATGTLATASRAETPVTLYLFWQEGCPHCARARATLAGMQAESPDLQVVPIELGVSETDDAVFRAVIRQLGIDSPGVPLVVVGDAGAIGFAGGGFSQRRYQTLIARCRAGPCPDLVAGLGAPAPPTAPPEAGLGPISLPWIGEVDLGALSLPLLTVVLAGVDGFNPCAMWVLALLIGLLLGVRDSRRMWLLGGVFLLATGAMYFAVMAAWLNVVLWLGAVGWIRLVIGALAVAAGFYYLREYWTNPDGLCRITDGARRGTISRAFQTLVEQPNLLVSALGVAVLAIAVNLVELACSAGLPAIYTQALAMHDLTMPAYYGYLLLYLAVFLLDDTVLFVAAMLTLRTAVLSGGYSRYAHLIGGIVLLALGGVMMLRPDLLG
ncbi:hypothetical protein [Marimonas arenosa]|uniref:Glutaredoxin n=1 Tax=Marimonas arenosa TaxID=1795305 RepID=A0AAE3WAL8_9RHOB|nr:hypothetical protein [Marimonas arenosa]MDQ2088292.1 glutaredoxin [Marimonas arenosa]